LKGVEAMLMEDRYRQLLASYRGNQIVADIPGSLVRLWCEHYCAQNHGAELVEVNLKDAGASFTYLFDISLQRTVVAYGVPAFAKHARDAGRMAGHPNSAGPEFHRGHLMAHSIGGGTDINLVPQLGKLNIGEFRVLERKVRDLAKQSLSCFYFVRPIYGDKSQTPTKFEQCVIQPPKSLLYALHENS
jgi:hypothetical protein